MEVLSILYTYITTSWKGILDFIIRPFQCLEIENEQKYA